MPIWNPFSRDAQPNPPSNDNGPPAPPPDDDEGLQGPSESREVLCAKLSEVHAQQDQYLAYLKEKLFTKRPASTDGPPNNDWPEVSSCDEIKDTDTSIILQGKLKRAKATRNLYWRHIEEKINGKMPPAMKPVPSSAEVKKEVEKNLPPVASQMPEVKNKAAYTGNALMLHSHIKTLEAHLKALGTFSKAENSPNMFVNRMIKNTNELICDTKLCLGLEESTRNTSKKRTFTEMEDDNQGDSDNDSATLDGKPARAPKDRPIAVPKSLRKPADGPAPPQHTSSKNTVSKADAPSKVTAPSSPDRHQKRQKSTPTPPNPNKGKLRVPTPTPKSSKTKRTPSAKHDTASRSDSPSPSPGRGTGKRSHNPEVNGENRATKRPKNRAAGGRLDMPAPMATVENSDSKAVGLTRGTKRRDRSDEAIIVSTNPQNHGRNRSRNQHENATTNAITAAQNGNRNNPRVIPRYQSPVRNSWELKTTTSPGGRHSRFSRQETLHYPDGSRQFRGETHYTDDPFGEMINALGIGGGGGNGGGHVTDGENGGNRVNGGGYVEEDGTVVPPPGSYAKDMLRSGLPRDHEAWGLFRDQFGKRRRGLDY